MSNHTTITRHSCCLQIWKNYSHTKLSSILSGPVFFISKNSSLSRKGCAKNEGHIHMNAEPLCLQRLSVYWSQFQYLHLHWTVLIWNHWGNPAKSESTTMNWYVQQHDKLNVPWTLFKGTAIIFSSGIFVQNCPLFLPIIQILNITLATGVWSCE